MALNCGIIGLPNVGKSTLFNALTATISAECANYPFCTIAPNMGVAAVPDGRLKKLAAIAHSAAIIPATLELWDIAGLVKGASQGEGLGNQFLSHIRDCSALIHVVRCFEDAGISHVENSLDPLRDIEIINTELMLADLESLQKRLPALTKKAKGGDKEASREAGACEKILALLEKGLAARAYQCESEDEKKLLRSLGLLTSKPVLYACNVDEASAAAGNAHSKAVEDLAAKEGGKTLIVSAAIEAEISTLKEEAEKTDFLSSLGLAETGLKKLIGASYSLLSLCTYFTAGPKESRAWTIPQNCPAPAAAGVIHSDFEKGFIRAEVIAYDDYIACSGESGARTAGKLRLEGKNYAVQDGDVMHFLFKN